MEMQSLSAITAGALLASPAHAAQDLTQMFTFGPTGYTLLAVALFALVWRFLRPHKNHRRSADKWPWE